MYNNYYGQNTKPRMKMQIQGVSARVTVVHNYTAWCANDCLSWKGNIGPDYQHHLSVSEEDSW